MKNFEKVKFKWTFRSYQQEVLDNSVKFLADGKFNIVAAPGSGKTILGLEMIRRLNKPCLILSPTTTIRDQWGQRFEESFVEENDNINDYVSYNLKEIKLINSITYQALYSSMKKIAVNSGDEKVDYSDIDIIKVINDNDISTICLDEAHHLQNEWQRSLERFIKMLNNKAKIISLTATPPYDASSVEWKRYIETCGEIDDEIFVPELVKQKTLCPHQDYVLFNFPNDEEMKRLSDRKDTVNKAIEEISRLSFFDEINDRIVKLKETNLEYLYENFKYIVAIYVFLNKYKKKVDKKFFHYLTRTKIIPSFNLKYAKLTFQFLLNNEILLVKEEEKQLHDILSSNSLIIKKEVELELDDKLKKDLITSNGKLESIKTIVKHECMWLKDKLRLVVLTDFIRKELVPSIGKNDEFDNISVVSIFESLRRENLNVKIGCLSGALVILPLNLQKILKEKYQLNESLFNVKKIDNTDYGIYTFKGNNKDKVSIISKVFEQGDIQVIVGTQALLGEGWDSPCLNTLILASYVGSFMLSNQMRGRAIRTYKNDPNKTANIWHLVTIEPGEKDKKEESEKLTSYDYQTLSRRFDCFVGPNYSNEVIESGIRRLTFVQPPFNEEGISQINQKMLEKAMARDKMSKEWEVGLANNSKTRIVIEMPKRNSRIKVFNFNNYIAITIYLTIMIISIILLYRALHAYKLIGSIIYSLISGIVFEKFVYPFAKKAINFLTPTKSMKTISKALLQTFKQLEMIQKEAKVIVKNVDGNLNIVLKNSTTHEQELFNEAIKEMFSPIENPRYLIIKKKTFGINDYYNSFACPSSLSKNATMVEKLEKNISKSLGEVEIKYVYNPEGRKLLIQSRRFSFVNLNIRSIYKGLKVNKYE